MRHVGCDLCGADDAHILFERPQRADVLHARFVRCASCGFVYADPRADADGARRHYEGVESRGSGSLDASPSSGTWADAVHGRRAQLERLLPLLAPGRVAFLEVGFGDASALVAARELGWEPHGLEYAEWLVDAARTRLGLEHVALGDISDGRYGDESFDVIYAWHVIEHVLDIDEWLRDVRRLLRPGGLVVIGTENARSLFGWLWRLPFRVIGRTPWPATSTDHTYWFTRSDLGTLLERHGLRPLEVRAYENSALTIVRAQQLKALRNPRWTITLLLYVFTALVASAVRSLGGKLEAVAVREGPP